MISAQLPEDEEARLAALRSLDILDTPSEAEFDDIVQLAALVCGAPIALVSLVDRKRQWFKAKIGLEVSETERGVAFCAHAILRPELMVVPDTRRDERFVDNPLVVGDPNVRFYAGAPLQLAGEGAVGTLCVIDRVPRQLTEIHRNALLALKRQVETTLALRRSRRELARANERLLALQRKKDALVQFLVHDMKNSLTAVMLNAESLAEDPSADVREAASDIAHAGSTLNCLVYDMLDVTRAERAGDLALRREEVSFDRLLATVAHAFGNRATDAGVGLHVTPSGVHGMADAQLLERVLVNLVDNAIRNSPSGTEMVLSAKREGSRITLVVADEGSGVPLEAREAIFDLYDQGTEGRRGSHGIGLAFCRLVAEAHGGRIFVEPNTPRGSRFCVQI